MLSLQENNYFVSFHSLIFHTKIHEHPGSFFERGKGGVGGNSLKWTYVEGRGGTRKMNRDQQGEGRGFKN